MRHLFTSSSSFLSTGILRPLRALHYVQGQSPEPKIREYFYYIDHQGQLFLDDAKIKNFTSCFKEKKFLEFFYKRLRVNSTQKYPEFPYLSLCGRERNYIRCDDRPIVFTELITDKTRREVRGFFFRAANHEIRRSGGAPLSVQYRLHHLCSGYASVPQIKVLPANFQIWGCPTSLLGILPVPSPTFGHLIKPVSFLCMSTCHHHCPRGMESPLPSLKFHLGSFLLGHLTKPVPQG
ncbi:UPF0598 protein F59C6.12,UPF0598 protein C8orf82,UPF0598 protein C8orf82 homolog [Acanthosepion pharaonis]|uniref:UPF0598 protein F59C6.12,UPF0598 protein C8orf82,UPF0598 protein C8orf82 homolog n=1 Tax=Acanthosepion pharaonis TaxID=158019 RepID=A0A812C7N9_ACAPH|nr:UPF0598 protein F59C6.12,UPF0598 protein C8orf82,UPF0598 protein C8orf82 homolog [Sepia pharaonis]